MLGSVRVVRLIGRVIDMDKLQLLKMLELNIPDNAEFYEPKVSIHRLPVDFKGNSILYDLDGFIIESNDNLGSSGTIEINYTNKNKQ
jgi:hypothetical protein